MLEYSCPLCDGNEIEVNDRLLQELDPVSQDVLRSEMRRELHCLHCGWKGSALQTVIGEKESA